MKVTFIALLVSILSASLLDHGLCYSGLPGGAVAVFYVKPTVQRTECPSGNSPCHSLQYYANHSSFTNNSMFLFLEGEHHLESVVEIINVANLSLVGASSAVNILCKSLPSGFHVEEFTGLSIENMAVSNCIGSKNGTLYLKNGSEVSLNEVKISTTSGFYAIGLIAVDVVGVFSVYNSSFIAPLSSNILVNYSLCVKPSYFNYSNNRVITEGVGTGLQIEVYCSNVVIVIVDSVLENYWDNMALYMTLNVATNNSALVKNSIFGGNMFISTCESCDNILQCSSSNIITLSRITISNDSYLQYYSAMKDCNILIEDSLFSNLKLVLVITGNHDSSHQTLNDAFVEAILRNVTFANNRGREPIVSLLRASVVLVDCVFVNNIGTAIVASNSRVILQSSNTFKNNSAVSGGGIQLLSSYMYLQPHTRVLFEGNHADYLGGAIYTDSKGSDPCFFHATPNSTAEVDFYGNSAKYAGSSVYGGMNRDTKSCKLFHDIFNISNTERDPSAVASDPFEVCFCDYDIHQPDCRKRNHSVHAFPGQGFPLRLAVVGSGIFDGVVPGTIHAYFNSSNASLDYFHSSQASNMPYCKNFTYAVNSNAQRMATLVLTPVQNFFQLVSGNYSLLTVGVYFLDCPLGFALSPSTGRCGCDPFFDRTILCDINDQSFLRPSDSNSWIGFINFSAANSNATGVIFYPNCPTGYCIPRTVQFTVNTSDSQCEPHRTGLLCGGCEEGYSLTLGNARCAKCPDTYLLLTLPLAIAGLLLVLILFFLNVTVTEGSINGLIFYANIIEMNRTVYFTGGSDYLYKFMAWLNLDLGIGTCLFNGMDGYAETWLQFVFPVYIWMIILGIILFYNKFPTLANRLGGQNAVKVLATLLLLSYTKLQRTIVTILSFTKLEYPDGTVRYVWLYDANVEFFKGKHIYLGIAGILVLVILIVPYTLCLAFFQQLQACSGHRLFQWVNKLKPVFDAYAGPYKDKYRFWTGMLLVVRTLLIILFAVTSSQSAELNLMIISVVSCALLLASTNGVYKKWLCNYLESYFYVQLIVFSVGVTYAKHIHGNVTAVTEMSFGLSLAVFLAILGYHIWCRIASLRNYYHHHLRGYNDIMEEVNHVRNMEP